MIRTAVLAVIICVLIIGLIPSAHADAWMKWKDQSTAQYMEPVEVVYPEDSLEHYVWQFGSSDNLLLDDSNTDYRNLDYPQHINVVGGGTGDWNQGDPSIPVYVRLDVKFQNIGTEDWTDFHLRAISGCTIYSKQVGDIWTRYWDYTGDESGWDYVMDPTADPSWGAEYGPVHTGEYFTAETWIAVTSETGDFEVELWPTAVVPEPSGILAACSVLVALAGSLRRKR